MLALHHWALEAKMPGLWLMSVMQRCIGYIATFQDPYCTHYLSSQVDKHPRVYVPVSVLPQCRHA